MILHDLGGSMKFYFTPKTRSERVKWIIHEMNLEYQTVMVDLKSAQHKQPEYLKINPFGKVPALSDGEVHIGESAAICMYLADKFPDKRLAPPEGTEDRAYYYQWMMFVASSFEVPWDNYVKHSFLLPEEQRNPDEAERALVSMKYLLKPVEEMLTRKTYLLGDNVSVPDFIFATQLMSLPKDFFKDLPLLSSYLEKMKGRASLTKELK